METIQQTDHQRKMKGKYAPLFQRVFNGIFHFFTAICAFHYFTGGLLPRVLCYIVKHQSSAESPSSGTSLLFARTNQRFLVEMILPAGVHLDNVVREELGYPVIYW